MKNRDWAILFGVFFAWVLAQSLLREWVGAGLGLLIGLAGLAAIAGVMWSILRRRKARAVAGEADAEAARADADAHADETAAAKTSDSL